MRVVGKHSSKNLSLYTETTESVHFPTPEKVIITFKAVNVVMTLVFHSSKVF